MMNISDTLFEDGLTLQKTSVPELVITLSSAALVFFISLPGNLLVILSVYSNKRLRNNSNLFIANLALSDCFITAFGMPTRIWQLLELTDKRHRTCLLVVLFTIFICTTSVLNLCLICIDRFIAITYHLRYKLLMNSRRVKIVIVFSWGISLMVSFIPLMGWGGKDYSQEESVRICRYTAVLEDDYIATLFIGTVFAPLFIIIVLYLNMYQTSRKHFAHIKSTSIPHARFCSEVIMENQSEDIKECISTYSQKQSKRKKSQWSSFSQKYSRESVSEGVMGDIFSYSENQGEERTPSKNKTFVVGFCTFLPQKSMSACGIQTETALVQSREINHLSEAIKVDKTGRRHGMGNEASENVCEIIQKKISRVPSQTDIFIQNETTTTNGDIDHRNGMENSIKNINLSISESEISLTIRENLIYGNLSEYEDGKKEVENDQIGVLETVASKGLNENMLALENKETNLSERRNSQIEMPEMSPIHSKCKGDGAHEIDKIDEIEIDEIDNRVIVHTRRSDRNGGIESEGDSNYTQTPKEMLTCNSSLSSNCHQKSEFIAGEKRCHASAPSFRNQNKNHRKKSLTSCKRSNKLGCVYGREFKEDALSFYLQPDCKLLSYRTNDKENLGPEKKYCQTPGQTLREFTNDRDKHLTECLDSRGILTIDKNINSLSKHRSSSVVCVDIKETLVDRYPKKQTSPSQSEHESSQKTQTHLKKTQSTNKRSKRSNTCSVTSFSKKYASDVRAAKTVAIVIGFFICFVCPSVFIDLVDIWCTCSAPDSLVKISIFLAYLNAAVNPLIYAYRMREFKKTFKKLLNKCFKIHI